LEGKTYEQIGQAMGVGTTRAFQLVGAALDQFKVVNTEQADLLRAKITYELEQLALAMWPKAKAGDPKSAAVLVQVFNRLARLHGLDSPEKAQAVVLSQVPLAHLTDSEVEARARMLGLKLLKGGGACQMEVTP
jgi:hypothetical protein